MKTGRTILHRIAQDLRYGDESFWNSDYTVRFAGNTRSERLAIVKEILRWKDAATWIWTAWIMRGRPRFSMRSERARVVRWQGYS